MALAYFTMNKTCFDSVMSLATDGGVGGGGGWSIAFERKVLQIRDGRLKALVFIKQFTIEF